MSRQTSPSPQSRRIPWNEFGPYRPKPGQDMTTQEWRPNSRDEQRRFGEDMFSEGQRRPSSQDKNWRQCDQEGGSRRRLSPQRDVPNHHVPRGSPQRDGGFDADRQRKGFREEFQRFNNRGRPQNSPLRFPREELPMPVSNLAQGWGRDGEGWGQGRSRDCSPSVRYDEQMGSRRERNDEGLNRSRQREDILPLIKSSRRETDGYHHSGFRRDSKDFGDQRYSSSTVDGNVRNALGSGPHGIPEDRIGQPRKHNNGERGDFDSKQRRGGPEQSWMSDDRRDSHEDSRKRRYPDNWSNSSDRRRSSPPRERINFARSDRQGGQRGRGSPQAARGGVNRNGNFPKNRSNFQQSAREYQNSPREEPKTGYRAQREPLYEEEEPHWQENDPQVEQVRPASQDRREPEAKRPRLRPWEDLEPKNMTVVTEETLTIKVDMSRPIQNTSLLCYSADRQLSLDLVNVGRQRPDLLPEINQESVAEFTQEIITLVHGVKELYFKGDGMTLNERFSELTQGEYREEEGAGLTLDQRFSSNRMQVTKPANIPSLLELAHNPGDLRHDLERRRQKRLEGVTITILGSRQTDTEQAHYGGDDGMFQDKRDYRRDGNTGPRRGGPYRTNTGFAQRFKNHQPGRTHNRYNNNNDAGPSW
ncbi:eukaryotic translation initiation factor 3 subunit A [Corythoichthys intestinalis]|uniref:eukaryotic translation initiation factor 3 subunit A n=1 Tax=Corythoichthys intestinalis TaxID=161448 RepID=UPI0025A64859|nr:eukaryotic translation initiation factor 3 subunit A [Corythoichthys intestinalis]